MIIRRPGAFSSAREKFGRVLTNLRDFNDDGYDDIYASSNPSDDSTAFIYFGGPGLDSIPDIVIPRPAAVARVAGDINHDGHGDLITSYPLPWSALGDVMIYFGGPDADSIADVWIRNRDMPEYQTEFGRDCAGIGDFNGDGIDDFAFSAQGSNNHGRVYVFAGWSDGSAVDEEVQSNLPTSFSLSQNYPNPFNPSTTIEFDLPIRSEVTLTVHNILGQRVATLAEGSQGVGTHRVQWDGTDSQGNPQPSGVYLYLLRANGHQESRKMLLLK